MICFKCGREQDESSNFCANCGADLRQQDDLQEQQQNQQPPQGEYPYSQPPYGYNPYGQYGGQYGQYPPPPYSNNFEVNDAINKATNSMVLGIIGLFTLFICCIGIFLAIPGLIMGINAKGTLSRANVRQGQGQAVAGIVLSAISIGIAVLYLFIFMLAS